MIITFYSYKGGTGRTMALANIAVLLAGRGHRVLAVDFDLEAPGLWRYFTGVHDHLDQQPGLIDLLTAAASPLGRDADWRDYVTHVPVKSGGLTLMTSGQLGEEYPSRVLGFGWTEFFQNAHGGEFLEQLRRQWRDEYDFTLIDSRTGVTDSGGICTIMLPDMIIPVFVSNYQSIDGAVEVITRAQAGRKRLAYDRPPAAILPIFSRFEGRAEYQTAQQWLDIAADRVRLFYNDWLPSGFTPRRALERTKLPYVTYFSFGEQMPALVDSISDPESLGYALNMVSLLIEQKLENAGVILGGATEEVVVPTSAGVTVTRVAEGTARGRTLSGMADSEVTPEITARLRVGVSGHRTLTAALPGLYGEISKAVEYITAKLAVSPDVPLTVVSSLAEGADRIVADAILGREGARLEVVLPLPPEEYRADFRSEESRAHFSRLLELDKNYDLARTAVSRDHAYELAGRAVVDRSDVMIIIWDGEPTRGRGGTAEIRDYARRWRRPVVLIHVTTDGARLVADELPHAAEGTLPLTAADMRRLDRYNREPGPARGTPEPPPLLGQADAQPWLAGAVPLIEHVHRYYVRADQVARRQQKRFRLVNRLLYILAPLAVLIVAAQVVFAPGRGYLAWFEFAVLAVLTVLHLLTRRAGWHARWLSARYMAEQLRSQTFLALTGILTIVIAPGGERRDNQVSWTERAAAEVWLTRPRFEPPADTSLLVDVLYESWIRQQQEYHQATSARYRRRSSAFAAISVSLFAASAVAALLHSLGVGGTPSQPFQWWDFLAIAIPAVAGALSSYAAQRDYLRQSERSRLFAGFLDRALDRLLAARNLDGIQQATLAISRSMRDEASDWYSAVDTQELELPA